VGRTSIRSMDDSFRSIRSGRFVPAVDSFLQSIRFGRFVPVVDSFLRFFTLAVTFDHYLIQHTILLKTTDIDKKKEFLIVKVINLEYEIISEIPIIMTDYRL
jgi:hypothetical protein